MIAYFGGGCFWCMDAVFKRVIGVEKVISGYAIAVPITPTMVSPTVLPTVPPTVPPSVPPTTVPPSVSPTYDQISTGKTDFVETIAVFFDAKIISYQKLLTIFFTLHDPTTLNRQGPDVGRQYRSTIFYSSDQGKQESEKFIAQLTTNQIFSGKIVTTVEPLANFYPAEEYHQNYYDRNPEQGYCVAVISPKLSKLRESYQELLKPDLV